MNGIDQIKSKITYFVGFTLFIGVFFNFIYDIMKAYGFDGPEWFWYVGQALETATDLETFNFILNCNSGQP